MKTSAIILKIHLVIIFYVILFSLSIASTAQTIISDTIIVDTNNLMPLTESGEDYLIKNQWVPDDEAGILPRSGCVNTDENKYYFYGGQKIIVMDGGNHTILDIISLDAEPDFNAPYGLGFYRLMSNLAYNSAEDDESGNKIYCSYVDDQGDAKITIFRGDNDTEIISHTLDIPIASYTNSFVLYDEAVERAYWVINYRQGSEKSKIRIIHGGNNSLSSQVYYLPNYINDLVCSPDGLRLFISYHNGIIVTTRTFDLITSIQEQEATAIVYNPLNHKVYVGLNPESLQEENKIAVIDNSVDPPEFLYNIENIPFRGTFIQGCVNANDNKVYFTLQDMESGNGRVLIIDHYDNLLDPIILNGAESIVYNTESNLIFCGGKSEIKCINGDSNEVVGFIDTYKSRNLLFNTFNYNIASITFNEYVSFYSSDASFLVRVFLGGNIYHSCYNSYNDKVYLCQNECRPSFVTIIGGTTDEVINILTIDDVISSSSYHLFSNTIFIGGILSHNIYAINGQNEELQVIDLGGNVTDIVPGPDQYIYALTDAGLNGHYIYKINTLGNYSYEQIFFDPNDIVCIEFDPYHIPNKLFIALKNNDIKVIDADNYNITNTLHLGVNQNISNIEFNPNNNKLYAITPGQQYPYISPYLFIINCNDYTYSQLSGIDISFRNICYGNRSGFVYITGRQYLHVFSGEDDILIEQVELNDNVTGFHYNEFNNRIYLYKVGYLDTKQVAVEVLDGTNFNSLSLILVVPTIQSSTITSYAHFRSAFNPIANKVYFTNFGCSSISIIQCAPELRTIQPGYTWLSFPRLYRNYQSNEPVAAQDFLENIDPFPSYLMIENIPPGQNPPPVLLRYEDGDWYSHYLDWIYSASGYILYTNNPDESVLPCEGTILSPQWTMDLYGPGKENWLGYFLPEARLPQDAFEEIWDKLTLIETQYWAMAKIDGHWIGSSKVGPITYGDMVMVKCITDCSFHWNHHAKIESPKGYQKTSYFNYEELADYTPVFVELDTTDLPLEIGAFCDSVCIGAETVNPGDTLVQINAYVDSTGQQLEFEFYYGTKNTPVNHPDYRVYNPVTKKMEVGKIRTNKKNDWYWISFRKNPATSDPVSQQQFIELNCIKPNPFREKTEIAYTLHSCTGLSIHIIALDGRNVARLMDGNQCQGFYSIEWDGMTFSGKRAPQGVYLLKIETPLQSITEKLIYYR